MRLLLLEDGFRIVHCSTSLFWELVKKKKCKIISQCKTIFKTPEKEGKVDETEKWKENHEISRIKCQKGDKRLLKFFTLYTCLKKVNKTLSFSSLLARKMIYDWPKLALCKCRCKLVESLFETLFGRVEKWIWMRTNCESLNVSHGYEGGL